MLKLLAVKVAACTALSAVSLLLLSPVLSGCAGGGGCGASVNPALNVYVTDAATGIPAARGATVTATDGGFTEILGPGVSTPGDPPMLLSFMGGLGRPGNYTVRITKDGYNSVERTVRATKGPCTVNTQTLNIALTAQGNTP